MGPAATTPADPPPPSHLAAHRPHGLRPAPGRPDGGSATANAFTWRLAHGHYENFSVVSALLPRRLRQDFCNVYAFCRIADDLGDEVGDRDTALPLLDRFREQTRLMYAGRPGSIVFAALASTVAKYQIPPGRSWT